MGGDGDEEVGKSKKNLLLSSGLRVIACRQIEYFFLDNFSLTLLRILLRFDVLLPFFFFSLLCAGLFFFLVDVIFLW